MTLFLFPKTEMLNLGNFPHKERVSFIIIIILFKIFEIIYWLLHDTVPRVSPGDFQVAIRCPLQFNHVTDLDQPWWWFVACVFTGAKSWLLV